MQMRWHRTTERALKARQSHRSVFSTRRVKAKKKRETMASTQVQKATSLDTQTGTQVTMINQTSNDLRFSSSMIWSGTSRFPPIIKPNTSGMFNTTGNVNSGSSAAAIYYGKNSQGLPCAWVFAWDAPADTETGQNPNKVYATTGARSVIDNLTFDQIQTFLSKSSAYSHDIDFVYRTKVEAQISTNEENAEVANVVGTFSLI
ncbi:jasmonate-induced protein homolog [Silene latifolia]|uniref:jasmonate-induced protein homolog n=1 Tax=Silene latifolia TaxID=37657 RepID=UPI003D774EE3